MRQTVTESFIRQEAFFTTALSNAILAARSGAALLSDRLQLDHWRGAGHDHLNSWSTLTSRPSQPANRWTVPLAVSERRGLTLNGTGEGASTVPNDRSNGFQPATFYRATDSNRPLNRTSPGAGGEPQLQQLPRSRSFLFASLSTGGMPSRYACMARCKSTLSHSLCVIASSAKTKVE